MIVRSSVITLTLLWFGTSVTISDENVKTSSWYNVSNNKTAYFLVNNFRHFVQENKQEVAGFDTVNFHHDSLSHRLQKFLPAFAATDKSVPSERCRSDSYKFLRGLDEMKMWALKMHDSSGKIPSGILNGNMNQFGDFDQCLSIQEPSEGIKGKFCLAYLQIRLGRDAFGSETLEQIYDLVHSHSAFRSKLSDPGHRIPRFSTTNWALCVPDSCAAEDVEVQLKQIVERYSNGTGFEVEVKVDSEMCQIKKPFSPPGSFWFVSCLILGVVLIAIVATLGDVYEKGNDLLDCFSFKKNFQQLVSLERQGDDIETLHGIRMLNALMLLVSHKSMALFFNPYTNRTYMTEHLGQAWSVAARAASLYTDPFIMISGILTSYGFIRTLRRNKSLNLKKELANRMIRIMPMLAVVILLCTFILPELGSGPQWNLTVSYHAEKCKSHWWRNFLFIHNYFGFENMCLTHTHHLGIDTQLFFVAPLLVGMLYKWPIPGLSALVALGAFSTGLRYHTTITKNLSYFVYCGASIQQMFDTANLSYIIPSHRLTVYILGIILGYVLQYCGRQYKVKPHIRRLGWTVAFSLMYYSMIKPSSMSHRGYVYDKLDAALYAAFSPIGWCLFFAWIIFVTHMGYGGILGRLLSSKYWLIWTRLSYAVYLTQFPVFFFNIGLQRSAQEYSFSLLVNLPEYLVIIGASAIMTLLFDFPFNNMKKLLLKK